MLALYYDLQVAMKFEFYIAPTATAMRRRRMNARLFVCGRYFLGCMDSKKKARDFVPGLGILR